MSTTILTSPCDSLVDEPQWKRQDLRVPRDDGSSLVRPSIKEAVAAVDANRRCLDFVDCDLQGMKLSEVRQIAKRDLLLAARSYVAALGLPTNSTAPENRHSDLAKVVLSGHQPELFHPGVWIKNFALAQIAANADATPVNLVIDNDLVKSRSIRVPVGPPDAPSIRVVEFDRSPRAQPWESATIADRKFFESFADRTIDALRSWNISPLLSDFWPIAVQHADRSDSLVDVLTAARATIERRWGIANLELPFSRVCEQPAFARFAVHLLAHLPRFRDVYNALLAEYRVVNRVRSHTRPVPELEERADGWLEAPFWVWSTSDPERRPIFARQIESRMELSDGRRVFTTLSITPDDDSDAAIGEFAEFAERGIRFRTRALTTTLFSRLILSDLFVHGIGGAKYDEMTDRIMWRFYDVPAPKFLTVSATKHLPLASPFPVDRRNREVLVQRIRDVNWNPDRHIDRGGVDSRADLLMDEKQRLIQEQRAATEFKKTTPNRKANWRANLARRSRFAEIRRQLSAFAAKPRDLAKQELDEFDRQVSANALLCDREYASCLFPEQTLRSFFNG